MNTFTKATKWRWIIALVIAVSGASQSAMAQFKSPGSVNQKIRLNSVGDAECQMDLRLPAVAYTQLKEQNVNKAAFLRRLGWEHVPSEIESPTATFDDRDSTIRIQWTARGYASFRNKRWEAPITEVARAYLTLNRTNLWERPLPPAGRIDLLRVFDKEVLLNEAVSHTVTNEIVPRHPLADMPSAASAVTQLEFPSEVSNVTLQSDPPRLVFDMNPGAESIAECSSDTPCSESLSIQINVQPRLMANIAKSYGTQRASTLWAARVVARNTGTVALKDYKVRMRLSHGAQDWTPWQRSDQLLPHQTVVDAFHPLLDPHSLAKNQSTQRSYLHIEYSYRDRSGKEVTEQTVRNIEILSRNEVVWSSFTNDQIIDFHDQFNNAPLVLASMATMKDPVITEVAGQVSGLAGHVAASDNDECAMKFLRALHTYIADNRIAYQTPPGFLVEGNHAQHVKYARDVLRDHGGTCVDLAILYASVSEAVGLEPIVIVKPGHAFPAVRLPVSKRLVPIESTCITTTFDTALAKGTESWKSAVEGGKLYAVNVRALHDDGIYPLDLEPVSDDILVRWRLECPKAIPVPVTPVTPQPVNRIDSPQQPRIEEATIKALRDELDAARKSIQDLQREVQKGNENHAEVLEASYTPALEAVNKQSNTTHHSLSLRRRLGVTLEQCNDGVHIASVKAGSPAADCLDLNSGEGIQMEPGDHIVAVNGIEVFTPEQAVQLVNATPGRLVLAVHDGRFGHMRLLATFVK